MKLASLDNGPLRIQNGFLEFHKCWTGNKMNTQESKYYFYEQMSFGYKNVN